MLEATMLSASPFSRLLPKSELFRLINHSMLVYLDYCSVLPFTGGELVYVCHPLPIRLSRSSNPVSSKPILADTY